MRGQRLRQVEQLRHTCGPRPLERQDHHRPAAHPALVHRGPRLLLVEEDTRTPLELGGRGCGHFHHRARRRDISEEHFDRAPARERLSRGPYQVLTGQAVTGEAARVPLEEGRLRQVVQVLPRRRAGNRRGVEAQVVAYLVHHRGGAAGVPQERRRVLAARANVRDKRNGGLDAVVIDEVKRKTQLRGQRREVQEGISRTADGGVNGEGVVQRPLVDDVRETEAALERLGEQRRGLPRRTDEREIGRGYERRRGRRHAQRLEHNLHRRSGPHKGATAHARRRYLFEAPDFALGHGPARRLLRQRRDVLQRPAIVARRHNAAGYEGRGQPEARRGHKVCRDGFIARGGEQYAVGVGASGVKLRGEREHVARRERQRHRRRPLGDAVADVRAPVVEGAYARGEQLLARGGRDGAEVIAARVALPRRGLDYHERFVEVGPREAAAEPERRYFSAELGHRFTKAFVRHRNPPKERLEPARRRLPRARAAPQ